MEEIDEMEDPLNATLNNILDPFDALDKFDIRAKYAPLEKVTPSNGLKEILKIANMIKSLRKSGIKI